jgi:hypothetical protein
MAGVGSAAVDSCGNAIPLDLDASANNGIRFSVDYYWPTQCTPNNPEYYFYTLTSSSTYSYGRPRYYQPDGSNSWTAYARTDGSTWNIFAGYSAGLGPSGGAALSVDSTVGNIGTADLPSFATLGSTTYLFFTSTASNFNHVVSWAKNTGGSWNTATALTSSSISKHMPAAVVFNSTLYLFYWNEWGYLMMKTYDGTSWSAESYLDGAGPGSVASNGTWDLVGYAPSTLVNGSTLYVFYGDSTGTPSFRVATLSGGNWSAATVDAGSSGNGVANAGGSSALYSAGYVRVYYFASDTTGSLKEAYLSGGTWHANVIDEGSGYHCSGAETIGTSQSGVAAVADGTTPQVYYTNIHGGLRVASLL